MLLMKPAPRVVVVYLGERALPDSKTRADGVLPCAYFFVHGFMHHSRWYTDRIVVGAS